MWTGCSPGCSAPDTPAPARPAGVFSVTSCHDLRRAPPRRRLHPPRPSLLSDHQGGRSCDGFDGWCWRHCRCCWAPVWRTALRATAIMGARTSTRRRRSTGHRRPHPGTTAPRHRAIIAPAPRSMPRRGPTVRRPGTTSRARAIPSGAGSAETGTGTMAMITRVLVLAALLGCGTPALAMMPAPAASADAASGITEVHGSRHGPPRRWHRPPPRRWHAPPPRAWHPPPPRWRHHAPYYRPHRPHHWRY